MLLKNKKKNRCTALSYRYSHTRSARTRGFAPGGGRSRVARSSQLIDPPVTGIGNARKANRLTHDMLYTIEAKPVRKWVARNRGWFSLVRG